MVDEYDGYLIWWLCPFEVEAICCGFAHKVIPEYVFSELMSLKGRDGRGRLWVSPRLGNREFKAEWPVESSLISLTITLGSHGGIVFHKSHVDKLLPLPGFVTDFNLNKIYGVIK